MKALLNCGLLGICHPTTQHHIPQTINPLFDLTEVGITGTIMYKKASFIVVTKDVVNNMTV
jgi:hypothetical protein